MGNEPPTVDSLPNRDLTDDDLDQLRESPRINSIRAVQWWSFGDGPMTTGDIILATDSRVTHTARDNRDGVWYIYQQVPLDEDDDPSHVVSALHMEASKMTLGAVEDYLNDHGLQP